MLEAIGLCLMLGGMFGLGVCFVRWYDAWRACRIREAFREHRRRLEQRHDNRLPGGGYQPRESGGSRGPRLPPRGGPRASILLLLALWAPAAHAAVVCTNPTNGLINGSGTSFTTGSITPVSGELALVAVSSRRTAAPVPAPTLTGTNGLSVTWAQVQCSGADCSLLTGGSTLTRLTLFQGIPSSGTAGTLTPDWGASSQTAATLIYVSCSGVDTATNQGVVQGATGSAASGTITVTLAAFGSATNATYMAGAARGTPTAFAPEGSFADWDQCDGGCTLNVADVVGTLAEWLATQDTTPSSTGTSSANWAAIGVEIKEATGAPPAANQFFKRRIVGY